MKLPTLSRPWSLVALPLLFSTSLLLAEGPKRATWSNSVVLFEEGWELYLPLPGESLAEPPDSGWLPWDDSPANATDGLDEAWLRARLPDSLEGDRRLVFRTFRTRFTLYIDQEELYDFGEGTPRVASLEAHVVSIPRRAAGRWLVVRVPRPDLNDVSPLLWQLVTPNAVPQALSRALRSRLLDDLPELVIAVLSAGVGLLTLVVWLRRRELGERALLYFGLFTLLYATRLVFRNDLSWALGLPLDLSQQMDSLLTNVLLLPGWLFFLELFGPGRRNSILWSARALGVFAVFGVAYDLVRGEPFALTSASNLVVIVAILVLLANAVDIRHTLPKDFHILAIGSLTLAVLGINNNLVSIRMVPWTWTEESIGFFAFVCSLGIVVARQAFATEKALVAVESELETARQIQQTLLPKGVPDTRGMQVAARYLPMSQVAGDLYDFSTPAPGRIGVLVADVSGHGAAAALIASMVKVAFTTEEPHWDDPARLLAGMNHTLCANLPSGFVTAVYVTIDETGRVKVGNGGHPHPVVRRHATGEVEELPAQGALLGRFHHARFESSEHRLEPGDRLLLYTDGLVETTRLDGDEPFGEGQLADALMATSKLEPESAADQLIETLRRWHGSDADGFDDDLTLLLVDRAQRD